MGNPLTWLFNTWQYIIGGGWLAQKLGVNVSSERIKQQWDALPDWAKTNDVIKWTYQQNLAQAEYTENGLQKEYEGAIKNTVQEWVTYVGQFNDITPENAQAKLAEITAKATEIFAASSLIDMGFGMLPNGAGDVSSRNTKQLLKWLGFGAVIAAIAHDPLKIGVLRPYQDMLEATFRNRRPDYQGILNAYKQRSLSTIPITDINQITDAVMDEVEVDNNVNMDAYGASWGYPQKWITIEKDAATRALTFGNLSAMARLGHYDRQMSIFSLWTYGLDRRLMYPALDALEAMRDVGVWKGFRSMVEPSYVQGLIDQSDLVEYWTRILVPQDVQTWALARLTKSREKFAAKEASTGLNKQRDLTRADFAKAYLEGIIDLATFEAKLTQLGYDPDEISVIVKLTDNTKKTPASSKCKRLSLSDYELAHKNGILTTDQVISRLQGEYCDADIEIERQLLALNDLTAEAPIRERDLSVSELTTAYVDGLMTRDRMISYLHQIGYDDEETTYLADIADIKKGIADAKAGKAVTAGTVQKERDLTLAQLTAAYVQNVIDENTYTADLASLGYDTAEVSILLKLAQIKKKLPTVTGLKRLPLSDYEKAEAYGLITSDDVLSRMQGEYTDFDIGLEKMMLAQGIARKG